MLYSSPHDTCYCKSENVRLKEIFVSEKESLMDLAKMGDKSSVKTASSPFSVSRKRLLTVYLQFAGNRWRVIPGGDSIVKVAGMLARNFE